MDWERESRMDWELESRSSLSLPVPCAGVHAVAGVGSETRWTADVKDTLGS